MTVSTYTYAGYSGFDISQMRNLNIEMVELCGAREKKEKEDELPANK